MQSKFKSLYARRQERRAKLIAERKLADLPDRLRADVGLGPARNGINDWMYDPTFLPFSRG